MIIVDTSVWIDHLRAGDTGLAELLDDGRVLAHPFVVTGELALGSLRQRAVLLGALNDLPQALVAREDEVMTFIEVQKLFGIGIAYADAHLLTSARLTPGVTLWTRDRRLREASMRLQLAADLT